MTDTMTDTIYQKDSYLKEIDAKIIKAEGKSIQLDKTIFYPTGGGQPGDTGILRRDGKDFKVINTKKAGSEIIHEVDSEGMAAGDIVRCVIDWPRRHRLMRGHTACHLLCNVVNKATGALITGNQIGEDRCRIDMDLENFDREQMAGFESGVNEIIAAAVDVEIRFLPREEAFRIPEVLKLKNVLPPNVDIIRIVDIKGFDEQACGGTHVKNTAEIKGITITAAENKGKNNRRIYFSLRD
jgi:misacylated tRNA(Ala) deacylase